MPPTPVPPHEWTVVLLASNDHVLRHPAMAVLHVDPFRLAAALALFVGVAAVV
jgi:hypothetical protein